MPLQKVSSGIPKLDDLIDSFHIGDNIIWEVVAGSSNQYFIRSFLAASKKSTAKTIYISFNHSPQTIFNRYSSVIGDNFILLDCFTSGKGKDDHTFSKYYKDEYPENVLKINRPLDIDFFTKRLNEIEDSLDVGACYIFDSLTGMQDLWGGEERTYKFFTYMCPRLFDLETVAHWIMEKDAHSSNFKANLRHITQVVFELSKRNDDMFIKALKLEGRQDREAFKDQQYRVHNDKISLLANHKLITSDIDLGSKVRKLRMLADMSQKDLADKVELTASSISQLENNQISPTMNNFILICNALNISPAEFWQEEKEPSWITRSKNLDENSTIQLFSANNVAGFVRVVDPGKTVKYKPEGNMFIYVQKGMTTVTSGKDKYKLTEGDSAMLTKDMSTSWKNCRNTVAHLLCIKL